MEKNIKLEKLNRREGARYLGYNTDMPDEKIMHIIDECEMEILKKAKPRYLYKILNISHVDEGVKLENTTLCLKGSSIKEHLEGCDKVAIICATLSLEIDKLIKINQLKDMSKAVITDAFAAVAIEQVLDKIEQMIKNEYENVFFTYRFGIGYGDLPISQMKDFLRVLGADRIGVSVTDGDMMNPIKSVACIVGISDNEIKQRKRGCITCNLKDVCKYRIRGKRCGF